MKNKYIIGYERDTYAEVRLFLNKCSNAEYLKVESSFDTDEYPLFGKVAVKNSSTIDKSDTIDFVHYFNQVNFGNMPFITTFETIFPRSFNNNDYKILAYEACKNKCKKIIAFSQATYDIQAEHLKRVLPEEFETLMNKTVILHPPQELISNKIDRFSHIKTLKFIFVGGDFFRKGGVPMLRALKVIRNNHDINLTIISDLKIKHNVTQSSEKDLEEVIKFIHDNSDWINWHKRLPNDEVLKIISEHHIGFLATLAETYGYSVLEMQAAGVPVITTNIRALPETNSLDEGWVINIPFRNGLQSSSTRKDIDNLYDHMTHQIIAIVENIIQDKNQLLTKSINSIQKINKYHNHKRYSDSLSSIYESCL